jgi:hypothetical protein
VTSRQELQIRRWDAEEPGVMVRQPTVRVGVPSITAIAALLGATITLFGLLGALNDLELPLGEFSLTAELDVPAFFSAGLLWWAAALAWAAGGNLRPVAVFFAFMGVDELVSIHEWLERTSGVDWQLLYLPVMALGGIVWLRAAPRVGPLWVAGAAAWVVAQVFELLQNDGDTLVHPWMTVPEEMLEMAGSSLWVLALLVLLRR